MNNRNIESPVIKGTPQPRLYLKEQGERLIVEVRFSYLEGTVEYSSRDRASEKEIMNAEGKTILLRRSMALEMQMLARLTEAGLVTYSAGTYTPQLEASVWVRNDLQRLSSEGFEVYGRESLVAERIMTVRPSLNLTLVSLPGGFIDCVFNVRCDGSTVPPAHLYDAVWGNTQYVRLTDGSTGIIPPEWIEKLAILFALGDKKPAKDRIRLRGDINTFREMLDSIVDQCTICDTSAPASALWSDARPPALPPLFKGVLRPYQQEGFEWFYGLQKAERGGCLADDMGLGKTVQTLALLLAEKTRQVAPRTSLLIVPTTLLSNWQREARTFAPTLLVMRYHGPDRKRYRDNEIMIADLVLTTYGTLQRDLERFESLSFNYIILDEAQAIKNPLSESAKSVRTLAARNRLALSGTPIENNLSELWSLFTFLNAGMLGTWSRFTAVFARPVEQERNEDRARILRQLVAPCILRRTKNQVARDLPPKTESIIPVPMTDEQRTMYDLFRQNAASGLMRTIEEEGIDRSRLQILQALTRLRQICCHPLLVDPSFTGDSGKFNALDELIENAVAEKHKTLIFSQFVSALDLIKPRLEQRGCRYEYLTGKTADRQAAVDHFQQDDDIAVMLISLKAGGVGLNLTAADYVILLDPWWNPASENQAADRAYRIGQTNPVFVYRLISEDSVEERVMELQQSKKQLFDSVIGGEESVFGSLDKEEVWRLMS